MASPMEDDWQGRWSHIQKLLTRSAPFVTPDFVPGPEVLDLLLNTCKLLVVGAGGLGCELLKDLALMGFRDIHVIDMDTIDLSNLNRQFLFRQKDIGQPKATVAANFINGRIHGCKVTPHFGKIEDYDEDFYRSFHIVVCGLDSIVARRWINSMLVALLRFDEDNSLDMSSVVPLVDGGTEGFKGNARVILPGLTACIECMLELYPPQVNFPMCTIAHKPRLPEHCIEYVRLMQWPQDQPFGANVAIDGDDTQHIQWIYERATARAAHYGIAGITYRLTQGVIKRIIPAVASTNAVIAAACATEVFKLATLSRHSLKNYLIFNDVEGVYTNTFEAQRKENCIVCSQIPQVLKFGEESTLQDVYDYLTGSAEYQMKAPGLRTVSSDGKSRTLYMQKPPSLYESCKANLRKTLRELGMVDGQSIMVADVTTPTTLTFCLQLSPSMEK